MTLGFIFKLLLSVFGVSAHDLDPWSCFYADDQTLKQAVEAAEMAAVQACLMSVGWKLHTFWALSKYSTLITLCSLKINVMYYTDVAEQNIVTSLTLWGKCKSISQPQSVHPAATWQLTSSDFRSFLLQAKFPKVHHILTLFFKHFS